MYVYEKIYIYIYVYVYRCTRTNQDAVVVAKQGSRSQVRASDGSLSVVTRSMGDVVRSPGTFVVRHPMAWGLSLNGYSTGPFLHPTT